MRRAEAAPVAAAAATAKGRVGAGVAHRALGGCESLACGGGGGVRQVTPGAPHAPAGGLLASALNFGESARGTARRTANRVSRSDALPPHVDDRLWLRLSASRFFFTRTAFTAAAIRLAWRRGRPCYLRQERARPLAGASSLRAWRVHSRRRRLGPSAMFQTAGTWQAATKSPLRQGRTPRMRSRSAAPRHTHRVTPTATRARYRRVARDHAVHGTPAVPQSKSYRKNVIRVAPAVFPHSLRTAAASCAACCP